MVAVGTSLVVITINSASALFSRLGQDVTLDWVLIGSFTAASVVGSLLGARITARVSPARGAARRPRCVRAACASAMTRRATPTYLNLRKASIYGGSNEIQRQIISRTILGL